LKNLSESFAIFSCYFHEIAFEGFHHNTILSTRHVTSMLYKVPCYSEQYAGS